jgi:hypothetical protein
VDAALRVRRGVLLARRRADLPMIKIEGMKTRPYAAPVQKKRPKAKTVSKVGRARPVQNTKKEKEK